MDPLPTPQLLDFLQQTVACCRSNASFDHVPKFARVRLSEAVSNIEFFLERREYARAMQEAVMGVRTNTAVVRYIKTAAEALTSLHEELDDE
jgi:hypothetical protein